MLIQTIMSYQGYMSIVRHGVENLAKVEVNDTYFLSLIPVL